MSAGTYWGVYWGGGAPSFGAASLLAWATSERTLFVTFSTAPLALSPTLTADALNPASWTVTRQDSGRALLVVGVAALAPTAFELYLLDKLGPWLETHAVSATVADALTRAVSTLSATCLGCVAEEAAAAPGGMVDLANPYFGDDESAVVGTLRATSSGDYAVETGEQLLRKRLIRRLATDQNEFFHLEPEDYGLGLRSKEVPVASTLPTLRAAVLRQVLREPEIGAAKVNLTLTTAGVLTIAIYAELRRTGQSVRISIPVLPLRF